MGLRDEEKEEELSAVAMMDWCVLGTLALRNERPLGSHKPLKTAATGLYSHNSVSYPMIVLGIALRDYINQRPKITS